MMQKIKEFVSCKRKRKSAEIIPPQKKPRECLTCALCKDTIIISRTLPCGDSFCEKCPICNIECKKVQAYPCFLLDEAVAVEEEQSQGFISRLEINKNYKEKLKIDEVTEGMKVDIKDTEGIWCVGTVKRVLKKEKQQIFYVHYERWDEFFDELVSVDSGRVAPFGVYTQRNILRYKLAMSDGNRQGEIII